jgi:hypothetical protein
MRRTRLPSGGMRQTDLDRHVLDLIIGGDASRIMARFPGVAYVLVYRAGVLIWAGL